MSSQRSSAVQTVIDDGYRVEEQIGFILRKAHQRATSIFETLMDGFDITPTQFTTLIKLLEEGEVSQNRLGRMAAMDPATTFGVISRLKKRNLITQRTDPNDARRVLLRLTNDGVFQTGRMCDVAADVSTQTLAPLSQRERATLLRLLEKIS